MEDLYLSSELGVTVLSTLYWPPGSHTSLRIILILFVFFRREKEKKNLISTQKSCSLDRVMHIQIVLSFTGPH